MAKNKSINRGAGTERERDPISKGMKRKSNLYPLIYSMENLELADKIARKGKARQQGIIIHDRNAKENLMMLQRMLMEKTYRTSEYRTFTIYEPKERIVHCLPYFPDRIAHHAIMNEMPNNTKP